ncbi:MAG: CHAT domain-containing protein [Phaeodactylibacter sp.]|nr:CHAT domain-containing protein [Phaeodactylibacter sp.]MCB9263766.1 CHAT domain-containing protein [Lewinellaceae bacterium]MCB9286826.1 CHAT domain-containing protein [Lewinellaceae bacterium]
MNRPIIFLAFANGRDGYLPMINRERKNIIRAMRPHDDEGLIKVVSEGSSSLEDIYEVFNNYPNQVAIFHYGGHAGSGHLQLEQPDTSAQKAYTQGLAQLLGQQESLQLAFLNGCATQGQVDLLLKHGVRAVIATSASVQDQMATEFAEQFYHSLSSHSSLKRAFQIASSFIESKYEDFSPIQIYRAEGFAPKGEKNQPLPWGLYVQKEDEDILNWTLPKITTPKHAIRNRFDYTTRVDVNDILIETICEEVAKYNKSLDFELNKEELELPAIKREIVDSFPTPIGEQLRKLFIRSNDPSEPEDLELFTLARLRQLALTYRSTTQFICFTTLSQLWDEKYENPALEISDDYIVDFNSFFALNAFNHQSFDYVKLLRTITDIFDDFQIPYFIDELRQVQIDIERNPALYKAYIFMNSLYERILEEEVEPEEVEQLCLEAEQYLGVILREVAFLAQYKLVTIKNIEIIKYRHETPSYRHHQIMLNRALTVASTGFTEVGAVFNTFTDNKSVLFIKTDGSEIQGFLNLTPFIIDKNALNSNYSSRLYLYAYQEKNTYHFQFLNNLNDAPLVVEEDSYPNIKRQLERFKAEIFGREYQPGKKKLPFSTGSRFSKKR